MVQKILDFALACTATGATSVSTCVLAVLAIHATDTALAILSMELAHACLPTARWTTVQPVLMGGRVSIAILPPVQVIISKVSVDWTINLLIWFYF